MLNLGGYSQTQSSDSIVEIQKQVSSIEKIVKAIDLDKTLSIYSCMDTGHDMERRRFIYFKYTVYNCLDWVLKIVVNATTDDPKCQDISSTYYFQNKKVIKAKRNFICDKRIEDCTIFYADDKVVYTEGTIDDYFPSSAYSFLEIIKLNRIRNSCK